MVYFDHAELEVELKRRKITQKECAEALGISRTALKSKLYSMTPFRDFEMKRILDLLGVSGFEPLYRYFFIEKKSPNGIK